MPELAVQESGGVVSLDQGPDASPANPRKSGTISGYA